MEKLKISFEIVKNYDRQEFRDFMRKLSNIDPSETCQDLEIELYIITSSSDQNYVFAIAKQYNIPSTRVIFAAPVVDRVQAIKDNKIEISFENNQEAVNGVNEETDAFSILVDSTPDFYKLGFKYITKFNNVLKIKADEKKEDNC